MRRELEVASEKKVSLIPRCWTVLEESSVNSIQRRVTLRILDPRIPGIVSSRYRNIIDKSAAEKNLTAGGIWQGEIKRTPHRK